MIDKPPRIALLIDADNSPAAKIGLILNELSTSARPASGAPTATGRNRSCGGWEELLHEHAIRPMQPFDYSQGQERERHGDGHRCARPALLGPSRRRSASSSSDADFTPLVMYLRAKGAAVYGFGGTEDARAVRQRVLALPLPRQAGAAADGGRHRLRRAAAREGAADAAARARGAAQARRQARRRSCATPSRRRQARAAGRASARSASSSATRRRSTRATTATRRSPSCSRRPTCSSSTRRGRPRSRCATSARSAARRPERGGAKKAAPKSRLSDRLRRAGLFDPLTGSRRRRDLPAFSSALVCALRASLVVSVPVLFMALSSFMAAGFASRRDLAGLLVGLGRRLALVARLVRGRRRRFARLGLAGGGLGWRSWPRP